MSAPEMQQAEGLDDTVETAVEIAREIRDIHRRLGETLIGHPHLEDRLAELHEQRDIVLQEIGRRVLACVLAGGTVVLEEAPSNVVALVAEIPPTSTAEPLPAAPVEEPKSTPTSPPAGKTTPPPPEPPPAKVVRATPLPHRQDTPPAVRHAYETPLDPMTFEEQSALRAVMRSLPAPIPVQDAMSLDDAIEQLRRAVDECSDWASLSQDVPRAVVGYAAAYARHLQDVADDIPCRALADVGTIFSFLTNFSKTYRPGFVYGLSRDHIPAYASWLADARHWWSKLDAAVRLNATSYTPEIEPEPEPMNPEKALNALAVAISTGEDANILAATKGAIAAGVSQQDPRLVRAMTPFLPLLERETKLKALRKAIRTRVEEEQVQESEQDADSTPSWEYIEATRGKRAVIIGGDPRSAAKDRIRSAFDFASVEWPYPNPKAVENLAKQIRSGSVDFVLYLAGFSSHDVQYHTMPACKEVGIPFVIVPWGYGTSAIRLAAERSFGVVHAK